MTGPLTSYLTPCANLWHLFKLERDDYDLSLRGELSSVLDSSFRIIEQLDNIVPYRGRLRQLIEDSTLPAQNRLAAFFVYIHPASQGESPHLLRSLTSEIVYFGDSKELRWVFEIFIEIIDILHFYS